MSLSSTTFLIYYFKDSEDRERNLMATCRYLSSIGARVLVWCDTPPPYEIGAIQKVLCVGSDIRVNGWTHRTRARNNLAKMAESPILAQIDGDVIIPKDQLETAEKMILQGPAEFVYSYSLFRRMGQDSTHEFCETGDIAKLVASNDFQDTATFVGGCMLANVQSYKRIGMENENYIAWGPEDKSRWERARRLGVKARVEGLLYHLDHERTVQSGRDNPFFWQSMEEIQKERSMTDQELLAYAQRGFR